MVKVWGSSRVCKSSLLRAAVLAISVSTVGALAACTDSESTQSPTSASAESDKLFEQTYQKPTKGGVEEYLSKNPKMWLSLTPSEPYPTYVSSVVNGEDLTADVKVKDNEEVVIVPVCAEEDSKFALLVNGKEQGEGPCGSPTSSYRFGPMPVTPSSSSRSPRRRHSRWRSTRASCLRNSSGAPGGGSVPHVSKAMKSTSRHARNLALM